MKANGFFKKHSPRLLCEAMLRSALCGIAVGFAANFVTALVTWFAPINGFWLSIGVWGGVSLIASLIFYFKRFRPSDVKNARRLDSLGLDERLITMVEFRNDNSCMASMQRSDAQTTLSKLDPKQIKIIIPRAVVASLTVCALLGTGMTTVNALSENSILPGGDDLLDSFIEDQQQEYVTISYVIEEGGIIEGDEDQIIVKGKDAATVTAVADEGFVFKEWSDGYASPTRTDTEVTENVVYIAIFTELDDGEGDGDGEGEGEEGDEPQDKPSDSDENGGEGNQNGEGDPNSDSTTGGGNIMDPANQIINNDQYYRDVIERLKEETSERLESNDGTLSQQEIDIIKKYLGIV